MRRQKENLKIPPNKESHLAQTDKWGYYKRHELAFSNRKVFSAGIGHLVGGMRPSGQLLYG